MSNQAIHAATTDGRARASALLDRTPWPHTHAARSAALHTLERLAVAGDAQACFELGASFDMGWDVPCDRSLAIHWFARAASLGHGVARAVLLQASIIGNLSPEFGSLLWAPGVVGLGPDWSRKRLMEPSDCMEAARHAIEAMRRADDAMKLQSVARLLLPSASAATDHAGALLSAIVTTGEPSNEAAMLLARQGILDIRVSAEAHRAISQAASAPVGRRPPPQPILAECHRIVHACSVTVRFRDRAGTECTAMGRLGMPEWTHVQHRKRQVPDRRYTVGYRVEDDTPITTHFDCAATYATANRDRLIRLMQLVLNGGSWPNADVPSRFFRSGRGPYSGYRSLRCDYPLIGSIPDSLCLRHHEPWKTPSLPFPLGYLLPLLFREIPNATWMNVLGLPYGLGMHSSGAKVRRPPGQTTTLPAPRRPSVVRRVILLAVLLWIPLMGIGIVIAGVQLARLRPPQGASQPAPPTDPDAQSTGTRAPPSTDPESEAPMPQREFASLWRAHEASMGSARPDPLAASSQGGTRSQHGDAAKAMESWLDANGWGARDWVGQVESIDTTPLPSAGGWNQTVEMRIRIAEDVVLSHSRRIDPLEFVTIDSELGRTMFGLRRGDAIRFSATFPKAEAGRPSPFRLQRDDILRVDRGDPVLRVTRIQRAEAPLR